MHEYSVCAASRAGSKHGFLDGRNQDAFAVECAGGDAFIAVCDGAGSREHSREGADIVAKAAVAFLSGLDWDEPFAGQAKRFLADARQELAEHARRRGLSPGDLACTMVAAALTARGLRAMQVGDGFAVVRNDGEEDYALAFPPAKGEYANETVFVTHAGAEAFLGVHETDVPPAFVCLSSDGVERQAIRFAGFRPHPPFFDYLVKVARAGADGADADAALERFLSMPGLDEVTDDDRTLVCALRVEKTEAET